jgi:hypothetical protein
MPRRLAFSGEKLTIAEFVPQLIEQPAIFAGLVGAGVASGYALLQCCGVVDPCGWRAVFLGGYG